MSYLLLERENQRINNESMCVVHSIKKSPKSVNLHEGQRKIPLFTMLIGSALKLYCIYLDPCYTPPPRFVKNSLVDFVEHSEYTQKAYISAKANVIMDGAKISWVLPYTCTTSSPGFINGRFVCQLADRLTEKHANPPTNRSCWKHYPVGRGNNVSKTEKISTDMIHDKV